MGKRDAAKTAAKAVGHATKHSTKKIAKMSVTGARGFGRAIKGFKEFVVRGSSFELAVGVVIGGATSAFVNAIVQGVINPAIAAFFEVDDFSEVWQIKLPHSTISLGLVLSAFLNLMMVSLVIYFGFILPLNKLHKYVGKETPAHTHTEANRETNRLLRDIKQLLEKQQASAPESLDNEVDNE
jgi:large conductance mechanosensitive channel